MALVAIRTRIEIRIGILILILILIRVLATSTAFAFAFAFGMASLPLRLGLGRRVRIATSPASKLHHNQRRLSHSPTQTQTRTQTRTRTRTRTQTQAQAHAGWQSNKSLGLCSPERPDTHAKASQRARHGEARKATRAQAKRQKRTQPTEETWSHTSGARCQLPVASCYSAAARSFQSHSVTGSRLPCPARPKPGMPRELRAQMAPMPTSGLQRKCPNQQQTHWTSFWRQPKPKPKPKPKNSDSRSEIRVAFSDTLFWLANAFAFALLRLASLYLALPGFTWL